MITVNLRPGKRRKRTGSSINFKGMLDVFRDLGTKVKDPLLLGAMAGWVCVLGFLGFVYLNNVRQLYTLEPRLEQARAENTRFKTFLADKRRQEKIRDSLLAQITVIRNVDGDRYVWPHVLDEVTKALPAYTWLVDLGSAAPVAAATPAAAPAGTPAAARRLGRLRQAARAGVQSDRPHHRHTGVHPVPAAAGSVALDLQRHAGVGPDRGGEGTPGHRLQHPGDLSIGRLGLHSHRSLQPVGEVR